MKDLKLPTMSDEDREKVWDNLKVDDKLVSIERNYWGNDYNIKYFTVVKKTQKGSIRLSNGELLKAFYPDYHIITDELIEWIRKIRLEKDIMSLLFEIDRDKKNFQDNLDYEDAIKLKEILDRTLNK